MGRRFVIIGCGVVGAAVADELTARGEIEVTVLDKGPLFATGGSSSHAPGLISRTSPSKMMQELADYTLEKFGSLDLDGKPCALPVGTLEVARTYERLMELHRRHNFAASWGWEGRMISAEEAGGMWPIIDPSGLLGGYATRNEGLAVALRAVEVQARRARARGAVFAGGQPVTGIASEDGRVRGVVTSAGDVPADVVICCAGVWGPAIAASVGLTLPMVAFEHQYAITAPVAELASNAGREATMPIVRHQEAGIYFRDHGDRVGIGSFQHRRLPVGSDELDGNPRGEDGIAFSFTQEDFTEAWESSCELMPALRETKLERSFNGIFAFTPDGYPLIGEHPELSGFWVAESVWVTHSAGVGRVVAETLLDGAPQIDASSAELTRFEQAELGPAVFWARCDDSYRDVYAIHHPAEGHTSARDLRLSPFTPRQRELGAVFFDGAAWERPRWYAENASLATPPLPERDEWSSRYWSPVVAAEHAAVRERAGLFDMTPLTRIEVLGPGAEAFLLRMCAGRVDRTTGTVTYTVMLDARGGIRSDVTVARLARDRYVVGANGPRDVAWLRCHAPEGVSVRDLTSDTCCAGLWGPSSRDILAELTTDDLGAPYLSVREIVVGDLATTATRISYAGELGWELTASADLGLRLWDQLWEAGEPHGLIAAGTGALRSLRIEKGYRAWGSDLAPEYTPAEAGIGFTVRRDGPDHIGKQGLAGRPPTHRRLRCLVLDGDQVAMGGEPVYVDDGPIGYVTSAEFGYTVGRSIAYAWIADSLTPGDRVTIRYFDRLLLAVIAEEPLFDPDGTRLRA